MSSCAIHNLSVRLRFWLSCSLCNVERSQFESLVFDVFIGEEILSRLFVQSERQFLNVLFSNYAVEAAGGKALPCIVNVREEQQIINAVEKAVKTFGGMLRCGGKVNRQIVQTTKKRTACLTPAFCP